MGLFDSIKAAAATSSFRFGGFGGGYGVNDPYGGFWRPVGGSTYDYRRDVGLAWENSAVFSFVSWAWRNYGEGRFYVERPTSADQTGKAVYEEIPGHALPKLLDDPNPHYDGNVLAKGLLLSYMIDGNDYSYVVRNALGMPIQLFYMPHFQVSARWPAEKNVYVEYYEYRIDGRYIKVPVEDIVHGKFGIDPANTRRGLSPITAALREIAGDNTAATLTAALMRNNGIPGLVISPKTNVEISEPQRKKLAEMGREKFSGDRAGEPWVHPIPVDVARLGFSPSELDYSNVRNLSEERISAMFGIPTVLVGLGAGLDQTKVGATMEIMRKLAYEQFLVPLWKDRARLYTKRLLPLFPGFCEGDRVAVDTSEVVALQENQDAFQKRVRENWMAGGISKAEFRKAIRYSATPEQENEWHPISAGGQSVNDGKKREALSPES